MNQLVAYPADHSVIAVSGSALPPDIERFETNLQEVRTGVGRFKMIADAYLFGLIGLDAVLAFIPIVGGLFSTGGGILLLTQSIKARASLGTKLSVVGIIIIDVVVGLVPVLGDAIDAVLRSHAWAADRILAEVDTKLAYIEEARAVLPRQSTLMAGETDAIRRLRDAVFRGGKTEAAVYIRLGIAAAVCVGLLGSCMHQQQLRQERILACEAQGGWFCSWRD